jgi:hypothetical protein
MTKMAGSGSISQRHGSPNPDPHQNVMDPQHCLPPLFYGPRAERVLPPNLFWCAEPSCLSFGWRFPDADGWDARTPINHVGYPSFPRLLGFTSPSPATSYVIHVHVCAVSYLQGHESSKGHIVQGTQIQRIQNPRLIIQGQIVRGYNILSHKKLGAVARKVINGP